MFTAEQLKKQFDLFNQDTDTSRSWTMTYEMLENYSNEYISFIRMDSSNNWLGEPHLSPMTKMWSIIIDIKEDFSTLLTLKKLIQAGFNIKITKVKRGKHKGKYGIRIYDMKKEPNQTLVKILLDFIFQE
ncbi:MAG: hypothetical protein IJA88_01760 [Clostridia bacterium]|nr:hypothetical protein [Clostridia bacterium]